MKEFFRRVATGVALSAIAVLALSVIEQNTGLQMQKETYGFLIAIFGAIGAAMDD